MKIKEGKEVNIVIDPELFKLVHLKTDNCTIVHCSYSNQFSEGDIIRIWPTTYLVQDNGIRKKMIQAYNIALSPDWKIAHAPTHNFTLLFEGLDKDCNYFDLLEDIPKSDKFFIPGIKRNKTDVYKVCVP